MNTHAHLRSSLRFTKYFVQTGLVVGLSFITACAGKTPLGSVKSGLDGKFQIQRLNKQEGSGAASPGISFYQKVLRSTLNSECSYYPSDSEYAQMMAKRCGPVKTMLKSFARFSLEPESAQLGRSIVRVENKIHFQDIPYGCNWLD